MKLISCLRMLELCFFIEPNSRKWKNEIRSFSFKIFENFKVFSTKFFIFAKFSFNLSLIKIEIFPFRIYKIIFLRKIRFLTKFKSFKKFHKNFVRILRFSRNNFSVNFRENERMFRFRLHFVGWTKYSRNRLNENLETLIENLWY